MPPPSVRKAVSNSHNKDKCNSSNASTNNSNINSHHNDNHSSKNTIASTTSVAHFSLLF